MLDTHVHTLGEDCTTNLLVDDDTNSMGSDVEDFAGASVVVLVGHTLLDGRVCLDVDVLPLLEVVQVGSQVRHAILPEAFGEHVTRAGAVTIRLGTEKSSIGTILLCVLLSLEYFSLLI